MSLEEKKYYSPDVEDFQDVTDTQETIKNQPARATIERLVRQSKYRRSTNESPNATIELDGKKFYIETIEDSKNENISQILDLFRANFDAEEVETEASFRSAMEGKTRFGTQITPYDIVLAVKNADGKIISVQAGALIDLTRNTEESGGEYAFGVSYIVTDKTIRQSGLAREIYISSLIQAMQAADSKNKKLSFAIGECESTAESFWNKVGWKRIYLEKKDKRTYEEFKYVQPPLAFDLETGEVAKDTEEAAQHFMIDSLGRFPPTKEKVLQSVVAFIEGYRWPRVAFKSDEAFQRHNIYLEDLEKRFEIDLENSGQVIYLDKRGRERAIKEGLTIREYKEADHHEKSDKEDF